MTHYDAKSINPRLNYLPWPNRLGALPVYPVIYNATRILIRWNFLRNTHEVFSYKASWKTITIDHKIIERKHHQFCRNEVNSLHHILHRWHQDTPTGLCASHPCAKFVRSVPVSPAKLAAQCNLCRSGNRVKVLSGPLL